jgi:hypothetical protein
MKPTVVKRLGRLEERRAAAMQARQDLFDRQAYEAKMNQIRQILDAQGFVQGPNESFMDMLARSLGMGTWQLRQYFLARSSGQSVQLESFR